MKRRRLIPLFALMLCTALPSKAIWWYIIDEAGWAAVYGQMLIEFAVNYSEEVTQTLNTIQGAKNSAKSVAELDQIKTQFGDAASILSLDGFSAFKTELTAFPLVHDNLNSFYASANPHNVLVSGFMNATASPVGDQTTVLQPDGSTVDLSRDVDRYKVPEALNQQAARVRDIHTQTLARRIALREEIAKTTEQLQTATTDAEVQKLKALLIAETEELESIESDVDIALLENETRKSEVDAYLDADTSTRAETNAVSQGEAVKRAQGNFRVNRPSSYPTL